MVGERDRIADGNHECTDAISPDESSWGGRGGGAGFIVYLFVRVIHDPNKGNSDFRKILLKFHQLC